MKAYTNKLLIDFYPRPPGGGRLPDLYIMQRGGWISIHALRVEGDNAKIRLCDSRSKFLSTPSGWRATTAQSVRL